VARIDVDKRPGTPIDRFYELIPVNSAIKEDPDAAEVINRWESKLSSAMDVAVGTTRVPLDARDFRLRTSEVNVGNLVADAMRRTAQADVAIVNSGGIRGNREYRPGPLTRRVLTELSPFSNVVCKVEVTGAQLQAALNFGVSRLPAASGQFPQVSGMTFRVVVAAPVDNRVRDLKNKGMTFEQVRAARPTLDFDGRYGATTGAWTTDMFVSAVYRTLPNNKK